MFRSTFRSLAIASLAGLFCHSAVAKPVVSSPKEQMQEAISKLEAEIAINDRSKQQYVSDLIAKDIRYNVFEIEELAKVYSETASNNAQKKLMKSALKTAKELEDRMGEYAYLLEMNEFVTKWFSKWAKEKEDRLSSQEAELMKLIQLRAERNVKDGFYLLEGGERSNLNGLDELFDFLTDENWIYPQKGKSSISKLRKVNKKFDWPTIVNDRKQVLGFVEKKLTEIETGLENDEDYNPHDVELGIHELRRDVRRIVMLCQFMRGYFVLDEKSQNNEVLEELISSYRISEKYFVLKGMTSRKSIQIRKQDFEGLIALVKKLGRAKDNGQTQEYLAAILNEENPKGEINGKNHKFAEKLISFLPYDDVDFVQSSKESISIMVKSGLIARLRKTVARQK